MKGWVRTVRWARLIAWQHGHCLMNNLIHLSEMVLQRTNNPSQLPSITPSRSPSIIPSTIPSLQRTNIPSQLPTITPSRSPSIIPSTIPSLQRTNNPSVLSSVKPSRSPTAVLLWHHSTYCTTVRTILSYLHVLYNTYCTLYNTYIHPCFRCWGFIFTICSLSHVLSWLTLYHLFIYKCSLSVFHIC